MNFVRLFLLSLLFLATAPLFADTINFDNINATAGDVILTSYAGYSFTNFSAYTTTPGFPGFNNGIVSGPNAAYSSDFGSIASATAFDFTGGSFGSGYYDNLSVTIAGLLGGVQLYSQTFTVNTAGAQAFTFGFTGIDTLTFTTRTSASTTDPYYCGSVGCSYFTVDDAVLTPDAMPPPPPPVSVTPEPSSVLLLATGLLVAFATRRYAPAH